MFRDVGFWGQIKSLAGVPGRAHRGLTVRTYNYQLTSTFIGFALLTVNPQRKWALITNDSPVDLIVSFGDVAPTPSHTIKPNGCMLINEDMMWTGAVSAVVSLAMGGGQQATISEASVEP
jgi:hypothetical protein